MNVVLWLTFCQNCEPTKLYALYGRTMRDVNCGGGALSTVGYYAFFRGANFGRGKMWRE